MSGSSFNSYDETKTDDTPLTNLILHELKLDR